METMSKASILDVAVGALQSTLSTSNRCIGEVESQVVTKNSEFDAPATKPLSTKRRIRLAHDAAIRI